MNTNKNININNQEKPIYVLHQNKTRTLLPKILSLLALGTIFYLGILLNLSLLQLSASEDTIVKIVTFILLITLVGVGTYISIRRAHKPYLFYQTKLIINNKYVLYKNITNTTAKRNLLDKIFHTYSIDLGNKQKLQYITNTLPMENYLQKLVNYALSRK